MVLEQLFGNTKAYKYESKVGTVILFAKNHSTADRKLVDIVKEPEIFDRCCIERGEIIRIWDR